MIPLFRPAWNADDIEAAERVIRSGWWAMGPEVEAFEAEFAAYAGVRYAVATNSGTAALELAARATGLTDGVVVVPALTFISTALAMKHAGNQVVFADIDEDTLCLDLDQAGKFLKPGGRGPKGVVPVWYAGHVPEHVPYYPAVKVIEDCAHAAGSALAGCIGHAAAWSFQAVKNLATGDGGMVTTNNEAVAAEVRRLRWCGIDKSTWERDTKTGYGWDYDITDDGEKANMCDIAAAIGRTQLRHLNDRNQSRRYIARWYNHSLDGLDWLRTPQVNNTSSMHMYVIRVPAEHRDRFIDHCLANGVSAGVHYKPLTHYKHLSYDAEPAHLPVTNRVWKQLVTLPLFPALTVGEAGQVIDTVRSFPI